ncbi:PREDICTED: putative ubiquitin-like-specific protease 1B isoform X3 [Brassica oleracea var. oleracea]|uniref:putative ubiquitin-like-specific protease 1B isoform X3 n=1 Tax=Brassica oleracea var. oleracea TaxID=109376 RepID=UPI0006A6F38B|nr:PREDICTED: putative ubiquitin-like-specific protease 1B isoform X3 [Brassica oleracea var. oleracea]
MAYAATKRKRGQDRFSDKPASSSDSTIPPRLSRHKVREFHARCRGFLRFRSLVRRNKTTKPTSNLFGYKFDSSKPVHEVIDLVDEDSSIEQAAQVVEDDKVEKEYSSPCRARNDEKGSYLRVVPLIRRSPRLKKKRAEVSRELFLPLKEEEDAQVKSAFSVRNRMKVLVLHKNSGIEIRGETLQCLKPCAWLNDDVVINLYLELLKERETRDPQKYFKCHFFNTFFYVKLTRPSYNYKAVRRWTRHKRLGYNLIDCDIIFVPIHGVVHWTLAVINKRECKFMYLDSLNGSDPTILTAVAKYFVDEVKDKNGKTIDISSWGMEYVKDLPLQQNGYDCGLFMLKYIDFYSRGLGLKFSQTNMPYFRVRTAKEILRLQAD